MSFRFFEIFPSTVGSSSITTSCDASLAIKERIIGSNTDKSSRVLGCGTRDTLRDLPPSCNPSSISSLRLRKTTSGMSDHIPGFVMCKSPDKCESATSFGRLFVSKYSARTFLPVLNNKSSAPF